MSPLLDDRGRLFGIINVIDILVVVLLAALVVFAFVRFSDSSKTAEAPITLSVTFERAREATVNQLQQEWQKGAGVTDDIGTPLGTLENVSATQMPVDVPDASGRLHKDFSLVYYDVTLRIAGSGALIKNSDGSLQAVRIGNLRLAVGKALTVLGPGFELKTIVTGVAPRAEG